MLPVLGPYKISSTDLPGSGPSFVDPNKTRMACVINSCDATSLPCSDARLLHEQLNCDNGTCDVRWYECPSSFGRTYTIIPSVCNVYITNFDNGLFANNECDGAAFGSEKFCFGQVKVKEQLYPTSNNIAVFEFDGHIFRVQGHTTNQTGMFNCDSCDSMTIFAEDTTIERELPAPPVEAPQAPEIINTTNSEGDIISPSEQKVIWHNLPVEEGIDIACNPEESVTPKENVCDSQANPAVVVMSSGKALVAYELRNEQGLTGIEVYLFETTVKAKVIYHRHLSTGRLLNDTDISSGNATFEVFDDFFVESNNGVPVTNTYIGFVNGPLRGEQVFLISQINRTTSNNRVKNSIKFNIGNKSVVFNSGNHISDINWFLSQI